MKQEKQLLLDEVEGQLESHRIVRYHELSSLTANKANEFRRELSKLGGNVEVMRKRVLIKAAEAAGIYLDLECIARSYRFGLCRT